jgi:hypothetical protein
MDIIHHTGNKNQQNLEKNGMKPIIRNQSNQSSNIVYKVPNINFSTAIRSSKRVTREHYKIPVQYDEEFEYYRRKKPHS